MVGDGGKAQAPLMGRYSCNFCPWGTYKREDMRRHLRTHTGEKPFLCPHCPYRATQKAHVVAHIRRRHCDAGSLQWNVNKPSKFVWKIKCMFWLVWCWIFIKLGKTALFSFAWRVTILFKRTVNSQVFGVEDRGLYTIMQTVFMKLPVEVWSDVVCSWSVRLMEDLSRVPDQHKLTSETPDLSRT